MQARHEVFINFINEDHIFLVPSYQRKYKWSTNNEIKCLKEDIQEFITNERKEYFLGSIVVKKSEGNKWIIVDGQQRITTFLLMGKALYDVLNNKSDDLSPFKQRVLTIFAKNRNYESKMKLNKINDEDILKKIINDDDEVEDDELINETEKKSNYFKIYKDFQLFFKKKSHKELEDFFYEGIKKIMVSVISLDADEDEFLVYESINSKGKSLSSFDLIKNYFIMGLEKNENPSIAKKYENDIFESKNLKEEEITDLIRQILAIETGILYSKNNKTLYYEFKKHHPLEDINKKLCQKILNDIAIFQVIKNYKSKDYVLPLMKSQLMNFYSIVHLVFKQNIIFHNQQLVINNQKNIDYALKYLSKLCVARMMFGFGRVESNRGYASLSNKLKVESLNNYDFMDAFNKEVISVLENTNTNIRMPSKKEIKEGLAKNDIYSNHQNTLKWTLIAIEQNTTSQKLENDDKVKIQHIFPQRDPNYEWQSKLESNELEQNRGLANTLGNLTITKNDIKLGNKFFEVKKNWRDKVDYQINNDIYKTTIWNNQAIKNRSNELWNKMKAIWWSD